MGVQVPPRTRAFVHDRRWRRLGDHFVCTGLVGQAQSHVGVDLGFVGGVGVAEYGEDIAERGADAVDLVGGHAGGAGGGAQLGLGGGAGGVDFSGPLGDGSWRGCVVTERRPCGEIAELSRPVCGAVVVGSHVPMTLAWYCRLSYTAASFEFVVHARSGSSVIGSRRRGRLPTCRTGLPGGRGSVRRRRSRESCPQRHRR